ncbi:hypothetical protein CTI12_AA303660 [Artemisia annua]|uniref:Pierisin-like domain-containing protein n=1 Tax=Artemisia annua TaxID=35608 RepID=A0A2U1N642_ARTAN|nr:hypothetical protein CTI12_AA303660 [Artemisia annua]
MLLQNYKSTWRGVAAFLRPPVDEYDQRAALELVEQGYSTLGHIMFRDSLGDVDSCNHVYRWDRKPYQLVFDLRFEARHQANTQVETYFNLESYVNSGRRPLDPIRDTTYQGRSAKIDGPYPPIVSRGVVEHLYGYEIYASGGIDVHETLCERYLYLAQAEIVFPAEPITSCTKNRYFNPRFDPQREIKILRPKTYYRDNNTNMMKRLTIEEFPQQEIMRPTTYYRDNNTNMMKRLTIEEFPHQEIARPTTYYRDNNTNTMKRLTIEEFP